MSRSFTWCWIRYCHPNAFKFEPLYTWPFKENFYIILKDISSVAGWDFLNHMMLVSLVVPNSRFWEDQKFLRSWDSLDCEPLV